MAGWKASRGRRTLQCLDCGQFWLWHTEGSYFSAGGMVGGIGWAKLEARKKRIAKAES